MGIGVLRRGGWLRVLRANAVGIARVLLLAFALQLALPQLDVNGAAALAGEAALNADLQSSLCHDQGVVAAPEGLPPGDVQVKHCVFCLPMAGDPATASAMPPAPAPSATRTQAAFAPADQTPAASRPDNTRSRAPPADPRTV